MCWIVYVRYENTCYARCHLIYLLVGFFFSNHRTLRIIVTMKDLRDHYTLPLAYIKIIYVSLKNLQKDTTTFYRNFLEITGILD